MIEFKGDCGHTVRARDEDAGKLVRCSYCGRNCQVPEGDGGSGLDSLFDEVERTGVFDAEATRTGHRAHKTRQRAATGKGGPFDPFAVALKLGYVAVGIIVIALLWNYTPRVIRTVSSAVNGGNTPAATARPQQHSGGNSGSGSPANPGGSAGSGGRGVIAASLSAQQSGVFIQSMPSGAQVFKRSGFDRDVDDPILSDPDAKVYQTTDTTVRLQPGEYTIGLAMRINDPALMRFPEYQSEMRPRIESGEATPEDLDAFFMPDSSQITIVEREHGSLYIVRKYEVRVYDKSWSAVSSVFLPRMPLDRMMNHLPNRKVFGFDREAVVSELRYYKVPDSDQTYILDGLERLGTIFYWEDAENAYRVFRIDPNDGALMIPELVRH